MATFVVLSNFTQEGLKTIKDFPKALKAGKKIAKSLGGEIKEFYLTMGRYDAVSIVEAPDIEAMLKALLSVGLMGTISTETLAAIPADKVTEIIKELP